jgi:glycosyltransferase involved in cell wall biosynthesis
MKTITVSVISDLTTDQRVIRICTTLTQMGFKVKVIARSFSNSLALDKYPFEASRIKCFFRKGFMQYAEFNTRLFFKLAFAKTDYYLSNDLDTLLPNYLWSKIKNKKIFYDTHEYFTGVPELKDSPLKRKIWKKIEDYIFPKLKIVYTVNNAVKNKYVAEYGNEIAVVRNVPKQIVSTKMEMPTKWLGKKILLMQGAGINEGRGGMELLLAMQYLPEEFNLLFIGSGTLWNAIEQKRLELGLQSKVEMIAKLPPSELQKITPLAYLGFSLDSFDDLNCLYNLPNKIFDYMQVDVPVIATAIPEVKAILEQYKYGICITDSCPKNLANTIINITKDTASYNTLKANCAIAAKELNWEKESIILQEIYKPYL